MHRALGDICGVTSAVGKVGWTLLERQREALCKHVVTSSLLNPTPVIQHHAPKSDHHVNNTSTREVPVEDATEAAAAAATIAAQTAPPEYFAGEASPLRSVEKEAQASFHPEQPEPTVAKQEPQVKTSSTAANEAIDDVLTAEAVEAKTNEVVYEAIASTRVPEEERKKLKESKIPTTRFSRLWHYGTLATGLGVGAINESLKRVTGLSRNAQGSVVLSEKNVDLLVDKISRMRGAALKMGQMLSIQGIQAAGQGENWIPPQMEQILLRVHDSANYMPRRQMEKVMEQELGKDWQSHFSEFDPVPIAAASIGQVHAAKLASTGEQVVVKIQYPGVANAIDSDLNNLKAIVTFSNLLPRGMYLDNTIRVAKEELAWECDYVREASNTARYRDLLANDNRYKVPRVVQELCSKRVLVMERLQGRALSKAVAESQDMRNKLGENLLRLCLREIFSFRFMQTDPNWSNFFYNRHNGQIELLDFGACREFGQEFLSLYGRILRSAARGDRDGVWEYSEKLGFVTGYETNVMKDAHIDSVMMLGEPFRSDAPDCFDFSQQTITARVRDTIPVMLRHRLTPPPDETYGLHKKLSGAFLLCTKLGSKFDTKTVWRQEVESIPLA